MMNLTGYMTINGEDAWTTYKAFLYEEKREDDYCFGELLKPLEMKEYTPVDFRERNGEELPDKLPSPCYKARDVTLNFAVYAPTLTDYQAQRTALMEALRAGWVNLKVKEISGTYHFYYKGTTDARIMTDAINGNTIGYWKVKFREPKPGCI